MLLAEVGVDRTSLLKKEDWDWLSDALPREPNDVLPLMVDVPKVDCWPNEGWAWVWVVEEVPKGPPVDAPKPPDVDEVPNPPVDDDCESNPLN